MTRGTIGEVKILFIIACVVLKSEDNHRLIKNEMQKNLAMILIIRVLALMKNINDNAFALMFKMVNE